MATFLDRIAQQGTTSFWNPAIDSNLITSGNYYAPGFFILLSDYSGNIDDISNPKAGTFIYFNILENKWQSIGSTNILAPVDTVAELATTYPSATEGSLCFVRETNTIFYYDGIIWINTGSGTTPDVLTQADVKDVLNSTSINTPLSANQGRVLNERLQLIEAGFTFRGEWDALTNNPSLPSSPNVDYKIGDFFDVTVSGTQFGIDFTVRDKLVVSKNTSQVKIWIKKDFGQMASDISYNNTVSGLLATNVQTAINELDINIDSEIQDRTNADIALQDNIDAEELARTNADIAITNRLDIIEGDDTTNGSIQKAEKDAKDYTDEEITTLIDGAPIDANTLNKLDIKIVNIEAEQTTQNDNISQNASDIAQEIIDRTNADIVLQDNIDLKANDNAVVHLTGNETVAGVKTFSSFSITPSLAPTTDYQAANKKYVDDASPTQLNTSVRYVGKGGNDTFNGQVNRKKLTIAGALSTVENQSANIHVEAGNYNEIITLGTSHSRINLIGELGDRTTLKQVLLTEANQQSALTNVKIENTDGEVAVNVSSTLSGHVFDGLSCGGNHTNPIFLNVENGGSGFITITNCDLSNKIVNLVNSTTPRLCFVGSSANFAISAGTNWTVVMDYNSQNIFEVSTNNNILRGLIGNSIISNSTEYNFIVSLESAGDGFYFANYTEAGVFATGDIILRQNPSTVVYTKHYNTPISSYYVLGTQQTVHKNGGLWKITASTSDIPAITASNGVQKVGNDIQGINATTSAKGVVQLSNTYNGTSQVLATTEKALSDGLALKANQLTTYTKTETDTLLDDKENLSNKSTDVNLGTSDTLYSTQNAVKSYVDTGLSTKLNTSLKGSIDGLAELDSNGKVPSAQLPAYVDDVLEFDDFANFPATGENGKIYIALDTNITYRWSGSVYVIIGSSLALGETSSTAYRGDRGKTAYDHSQLTTGNPHNVTKTEVGLANVDNTSDINKPISSATQTALDAKINSNLINQANGVVGLDGTLGAIITDGIKTATIRKSNVQSPSNIDLILPATSSNLIGDTQLADSLASYYTKTNSDAKFQDLVVKVANETAMLALTGIKIGYIVARVDLTNALYRLNALPASTLGNWEAIGGSSGGGAWGDITGTLSNQTDLQDALDLKANQATTYTKIETDTLLDDKENTITAGTSAQYYRGDKTMQTLDKAAVGLSDVPNVNATILANTTITGTFTTSDTPIVTSDNGKLAFEKAQGQLNNKQGINSALTSFISAGGSASAVSGTVQTPSFSAQNVIVNTRHNLLATIDPTSSNDITQGYTTSSKWLNRTTSIEFYCVSSTTGAAVWQQVRNTTASTIPFPRGSVFHCYQNNVDGALLIDGSTQYSKATYPELWSLMLDLSHTITLTIADPCLITIGADYPTGTPVFFTTTGTLPSNITAGRTYYLERVNTTQAYLHTTVQNAIRSTLRISTSGQSQSGTHTIQVQKGLGQSINLTDFQLIAGMVLAGRGATGFTGFDARETIFGESTHFQVINEMPSHNHTFTEAYSGSGSYSDTNTTASGTTLQSANSSIGFTGGSAAMNITQPTAYINQFIVY